MGISKSEARKRVAKEGGLDGLPFFNTYQVMVYLNVSDGSLKSLLANDPTFPQPTKHGINRNTYSKAELDDWKGASD